MMQCDPSGGLQLSERCSGTFVQASANVAAAANNQTLAAAAGKITYVSGFQITGGGATAASVILVTLTDGTKTLNYNVPVPAGATAGVTPLVVMFDPPLPGTAANTAWTLNVPSFGAGNTQASAAIEGFQL